MAIFDIGQIAADQVYFYDFQFQKTANFFACACGTRMAKFPFSKYHGTLKINIFLFAETFLLHQRTIAKKNSKLKFVYYCFLSQNGQNGPVRKKKQKMLSFSSFLALKKIDEEIPPWRRLQNFNS